MKAGAWCHVRSGVIKRKAPRKCFYLMCKRKKTALVLVGHFFLSLGRAKGVEKNLVLNLTSKLLNYAVS